MSALGGIEAWPHINIIFPKRKGCGPLSQICRASVDVKLRLLALVIAY